MLPRSPSGKKRQPTRGSSALCKKRYARSLLDARSRSRPARLRAFLRLRYRTLGDAISLPHSRYSRPSVARPSTPNELFSIRSGSARSRLSHEFRSTRDQGTVREHSAVGKGCPMGAESGERSAQSRTQGGSHGRLHSGATRADPQVHLAYQHVRGLRPDHHDPGRGKGISG